MKFKIKPLKSKLYVEKLGDKYEIIPYNLKKRPRKIKNINNYIAVSVGLYGLTLGLTVYLRPDISFYDSVPLRTFYDYIISILSLCMVAVSLGLFFIKWKKNDNEYDLKLILISALWAFVTYFTFPNSTF